MVSINLEGLRGDYDSTGRERKAVTGTSQFSITSPLRGYMIIHTTFLEQTFSLSKLFAEAAIFCQEHRSRGVLYRVERSS